jgi:hypothetical protein
MATSKAVKARSSEIAIFGRVLSNAREAMSAHLARYVLTLGFADDDQARMRVLATRNQGGELSSEEHEELMNFVKAGHLLALLHSQARKALRKQKVS